MSFRINQFNTRESIALEAEEIMQKLKHALKQKESIKLLYAHDRATA